MHHPAVQICDEHYKATLPMCRQTNIVGQGSTHGRAAGMLQYCCQHQCHQSHNAIACVRALLWGQMHTRNTKMPKRFQSKGLSFSKSD